MTHHQPEDGRLEALIGRLEVFDPLTTHIGDALALKDWLGDRDLAGASTLMHSLDAVTALVAERLPGALWTLASGRGSTYAHIGSDEATATGGEAKTAPCALLIAVLRCLDAQKG